jgi:hypothetical protein
MILTCPVLAEYIENMDWGEKKDQGIGDSDFDLRSETERIDNHVNQLRGRLAVDNGEIRPLSRPLMRHNGLSIDSIDATYAGRGRHTLDQPLFPGGR